jgi:hypothetical protein
MADGSAFATSSTPAASVAKALARRGRASWLIPTQTSCLAAELLVAAGAANQRPVRSAQLSDGAAVQSGMRATVARSLIIAVMLVIATGAFTAIAGAATHAETASPPSPLKLQFKRAARGWLAGTSQDRYVLIASSVQAPSAPIIIDDATQRVLQIPVPASWCAPVGLSGTRVVLNCGSRWQPDVHAYSFTAHEPVSLPQFKSGCNEGDPTCGAEPVAVGADWIEYTATPCYHCGGSQREVFQSLSTGKLFAGALTSRTVPNLNRPQLSEAVCSPLRVPSGGSLMLAGRFALARSTHGIRVERCGSKRPVLTVQARVAVSTAQRRAIIWQQGNARILKGIRLPSLRRFAIALPKRIFAGAPTIGGLFLTDRTLYVETFNQATQLSYVWAAPAKHL